MTDLRTWLRYNRRCAPNAWEASPRVTLGNSSSEELVGNVHFGFCRYYQSIVVEGFAERMLLLANENPDYLVFVAGHSLGAAAASICAADLTQRLGIAKERVMLYTLGEPRTGDGIFARGLKDSVVSS